MTGFFYCLLIHFKCRYTQIAVQNILDATKNVRLQIANKEKDIGTERVGREGLTQPGQAFRQKPNDRVRFDSSRAARCRLRLRTTAR